MNAIFKNPVIRFLFWILAVGVLAWLLAAFFIIVSLIHESKSREYVFDVPEGTVLSEEVALQYTKRALIKAGKNPSSMKPVRRWEADPEEHKGFFFRRNTTDPNDGDVLWWVDSSANYSVRVSLQGDKISCRVVPLK